MPLHTDNPLDLFILTVKSGNRKVGKGTPVSMSTMATCPPSCKLKAGCYATCGRLGLVWFKLTVGKLTNGVGFTEFCRRVAGLGDNVTIWRHNQAGDLPGNNNRLHRGRCLQLARANCAGGRNRGGYTYTHYPMFKDKGIPESVAKHNRGVVRDMNALGFTVNLSADNADHADQLTALDIGPVACLMPMDADKRVKTAEGNTVLPCPAVLDGSETNCVECKLCQIRTKPSGAARVIVGFPAHGTSKRRADLVARAE